MKKNILLPTDFSDNAWSAAVYALNLFEEQECTFHFLNALKPQVAVPEYVPERKIVVDKELLELKDMAETSNKNYRHSFKTIQSNSDLKKATNDAVKDLKIDLIVMGTKGATGAKEFFYGSNTVSTLEKIKDCPVLVVPDEYDYMPPKQIAFPTDFNRAYKPKEIQHLRDLASLFGSKFRIMHVAVEEKLTSQQQRNQVLLNEFLNDFETSLHWLPNYTHKRDTINDFVNDMEIDILAMVNYKHSFMEKITKEPVIKKIGFKPVVPFFVVPGQGDLI